MSVKSINFTNFELNANVMTLKDENENIWFKAKDVASALGHTNPERAIRKYMQDKHKRLLKETQGVTPFAVVFNRKQFSYWSLACIS